MPTVQVWPDTALLSSTLPSHHFSLHNRKAWFEWPETNVWIWQLVQQELSEHVERRREEFKQQLTEKTHGEKTWTELTVQEAPIVLDFGRCKQREEEHKQKLLTHRQNQQASCAKRVTIERGPLSFVEF